MRQIGSGLSFIMPDKTGFFYSLITLYTILGQNSNFWDRRRKIYSVGEIRKFCFVRKIHNFYFVRKMYCVKMKILFRKENVPGPPRFNTLKC